MIIIEKERERESILLTTFNIYSRFHNLYLHNFFVIVCFNYILIHFYPDAKYFHPPKKKRFPGVKERERLSVVIFHLFHLILTKEEEKKNFFLYVRMYINFNTKQRKYIKTL